MVYQKLKREKRRHLTYLVEVPLNTDTLMAFLDMLRHEGDKVSILSIKKEGGKVVFRISIRGKPSDRWDSFGFKLKEV